MTIKNLKRSINILLVVKNEDHRNLMQKAFDNSSYPINIESIMDSKEALSFSTEEKDLKFSPDLIILDINISENGQEILSKLKQHNKFSIVPLIVISSLSTQKEIMSAYKLKVNSFISKPINFDNFFHVVQKIESFWFQTAILPTMI